MEFIYENSLTRQDALRELCDRWDVRPKSDVVLLDQACGRVTAHEMRAVCSLPVHRSSKRDGIAVRSADFANGMPDTRAWQRGLDFVQADTGDDFDDAFDAVIAVEDIAYDADGTLCITGEGLDIHPGTAVNSCGSIVHAGEGLVAAHTRLTPELVAALAVGGHAQVCVLQRPMVAYIPTGSELVPYGSCPQRGQNLEANGLMVRGLLAQWGADALCYPIVGDDRAALEAALDRALEVADIVLINGGSSRGEEDFNARMLEERGSFFRHGVRAIPGRPVGIALVHGTPVINVPGPVLAAFLCMDWLIKGLVARHQGVAVPRRQSVRARMTEDLNKPLAFERLSRVCLTPGTQGGLLCTPLPFGMSVPNALRESDGMLVLPIGCAGVAAGEEVSVELLRPIELIEDARGIQLSGQGAL